MHWKVGGGQYSKNTNIKKIGGGMHDPPTTSYGGPAPVEGGWINWSILSPGLIDKFDDNQLNFS